MIKQYAFKSKEDLLNYVSDFYDLNKSNINSDKQLFGIYFTNSNSKLLEVLQEELNYQKKLNGNN